MAERAERGLLISCLLVACLLLSTVVAGCTKDDPDPAVARRERVETRLRSTFSATQARCVMARLDARTLVALDRSRTLRPSSPDLERYSRALRACVVPEAATTTRADPGTTAAAPATTGP